MELPQLKDLGKVVAGLLLICATAFAVLTVLAYFPNKMPSPGKGEDAWYSNTRFKMTLLEVADTTAKTKDTLSSSLVAINRITDSLQKVIDAKRAIRPVDSPYLKDEKLLKQKKDSASKIMLQIEQLKKQLVKSTTNENRIHLNTILLILVASMGFLGNMVHIASSFTSFVGNGTFEKRWLLWYCVKPFTAAGLSVIIYFVIRAGFMGYGSDASSVNLYGILALSALAGLFTDNATLKLKEVFDVIFKPKDERGDKLTDKIKVTQLNLTKIDVAAANKIVLTGENFDKRKLQVKINGTSVDAPVVKPKTIEFIYNVAAADKSKTSFELTIHDDSGNEIYKNNLGV